MFALIRMVSVMAGRKLGQHFLISSSTIARIVSAADVDHSDYVVEVGPGRGALTRLLAARSGCLLAIEKDPDLADMLSRRFSGESSVSVKNFDARDGAMVSNCTQMFSSYKMVASLPYYASTRIIRVFLECEPSPQCMVVVIQREVAERMAAPPGRASLLSLVIQNMSIVSKLFDVPPSDFYPPPKVVSSAIRFIPFACPKFPELFSPIGMRLLKSAFNSSRKTLRNSLSGGMQISPRETGQALYKAGIDPQARPAVLSLKDWSRVYRVWGESFCKELQGINGP